MASDNEIVYEIKANTNKILSSIEEIDKAGRKTAEKGGGIGAIDIALGSLAAKAAETAAIYIKDFVVGAIGGSITAAIEAEDALNKMNQALANVGRLSQSSSADFQNFASYIQSISTIADDAAMNYLALASAFTRTNEEAKKLVLAAINMSSQMGISVDSAIRNLGGSLSGITGQLARMLPQVRGMTEEQLKAGKAIDLVADRFKNSAAKAAETFSGQLKKLKNSFGDLLEEMGFFFTKSGALRTVFKMVRMELDEVTKSTKLFREKTGDIWDPILRGVLTVAQYFVVVLGPALDLVNNTINHLRKVVGLAGEAFVAFFSGDYGKAIRLAGETLEQAMNTDDFKLYGTQAGVNWLEGAKERIAAGAGSILEALPAEMAGDKGLGPTEDEKTKVVEDLSMIGLAYDSLATKIINYKEKIEKNWKELRKQLFGILIQGVVQGMTAVGQALVNGGNALEAFGKAMLATFGQLAIQMGTFWFIEGLILTYHLDPRGPLVAAGGLAMIALGGVLQALGGGGGAAAGAGGGAATASGGAATPVGDSSMAMNDQEERQRLTNIEVNIAGNVLGDKRTLGLEIADALNEAFGSDGIVIARGAVV